MSGGGRSGGAGGARKIDLIATHVTAELLAAGGELHLLELHRRVEDMLIQVVAHHLWLPPEQLEEHASLLLVTQVNQV